LGASNLLPLPLPPPLPPLLLASHYLLQASVFRRAYYSAVSFTDRNVGVLLDELSALQLTDRTLVALVGDHGWQLGEMDLCRKMLRAWRAPSW
jgi:arylsulfatase A-like enzyme